jgi:AraC family transcriptional regulator of adaptative response / DNA-3-methyladenine glycosylase II
VLTSTVAPVARAGSGLELKAGGVEAVLTTGIYCRSGCSARPLPGNVRHYPLAAAAEAAGFRACHRCRPYRTSDTAAWVDGPALVARAVQLVLAGALDTGTEGALAARLGVSARHLRRLFDGALGVTPDQLARSRRAHFARRLLDDTDLPLVDVALAAGFGSARQLHRSLTATFGASPTELRARRRRADRLVADGGLDLRLPFRPPLAGDRLLAFLARRALPGVESVDGGVYRRTVVIAGDPGVLEIRPGGDDHLVLRAHLPHWEGLLHVVHAARALFDLDADPADVDAALGADATLGPSVRAHPGLRLPGTWDPFETAVRVVLGQQVSVAGARTLAGRLVARHGRPVGGLGPFGLTHLFPPAEVLATADLDGLGLPGARAAAVRTLAVARAEGRLPLDGARGLDDLEAELVALPGIGRWTAHALAMRLGQRDAFPAGDLVVRRALGAPGAPGAPADEAEAARRAEAWRPWRAYAALHLWELAGGGPAVAAAAPVVTAAEAEDAAAG